MYVHVKFRQRVFICFTFFDTVNLPQCEQAVSIVRKHVNKEMYIKNVNSVSLRTHRSDVNPVINAPLTSGDESCIFGRTQTYLSSMYSS